jgi:hypothetical protein
MLSTPEVCGSLARRPKPREWSGGSRDSEASASDFHMLIYQELKPLANGLAPVPG